MPTDTKSSKPTPHFDRDTLTAVLKKIDPAFAADSLAALIKAAGGNEADAIQALLGQLNKVVLGGAATVAEADLPALIDAINASSASGSVISLAGADSAKLASLAGSDIGVRYALIHGLPFALTGNPALYDNLNRDGNLFKFDPNTGEKLYTDEWLKDRAQFLAVKFNAGGESAISVSGSQSWIFEEHTGAGTTRVQVNADQAERAANKMVFASDTTETQTLVGSSGGDKIYSGAGDDIINAGAGDDYVEGGAGGDMIDGGRGDDTLLGGRGDDQIDGGLGNDKLDGGAGADYLVGGKGDDRMEGGNGFDTYVIDAGDGNDVVVDADGLGEIIFDGQKLTGVGALQDGKYLSADGKVGYSFAGDLTEGGVLTIATESSSIRVVNFKNGALGITLSEGAANIDGNIEFPALTGPFTGATNRPVDTVTGHLDIGSGKIEPAPAGGEPGGALSFAVSGTSSSQPQAAATLDGGAYGDLFSDPLASLPLVTGDNVNQAIDTHYSLTSKAANKVAGNTLPAPGNVTFLDPGFMANEGISARHIEYALMDFHDAMNIGANLGGDNLGDSTSIGVGSLTVGAAFDSKQLSDDKYTDLGSKRIGVKG